MSEIGEIVIEQATSTKIKKEEVDFVAEVYQMVDSKFKEEQSETS